MAVQIDVRPSESMPSNTTIHRQNDEEFNGVTHLPILGYDLFV